jgi:hypothetical protein
MTEASVSKPSPRDVMPNVARLIDEARAKYGAEHVRRCIALGMRGEPGWFYAFENGMVQGTPFTADQVTTKVLQLAVALGGRYAMVLRPPERGTHGAH